MLTSADLIVKDNNRYNLETINGGKLKATAFRINPSKNTALLVLDEKTKYTPLSLNLDLPDVGQNGFLALGLLDIDGSFENGEGYLDNAGTVNGYRYSDEKGAQIIIDTFVQTVTIGGALIDEHGTINGFAADGKKPMTVRTCSFRPKQLCARSAFPSAANLSPTRVRGRNTSR